MSKKLFVVLSALVILSILVACAPAAPTAAVDPNAPDASAKIEVWIDAAREESAGKFATKFADKGPLVTLTTTDYGQLPQKILFWNNVGGGWPDASFGGPNIVLLINDASHQYLGDMKPFVKKEVVDGFAAGALENCWDGEKLYCLRNDLAFYVIWYNAPKVKELGVTIPTTYEEMLATCIQVKKDHPEIQCALNQDGEAFISMLVSAQCPAQQILGPGKIRINALHDNCKKAAKWFDQMTSEGLFKSTICGPRKHRLSSRVEIGSSSHLLPGLAITSSAAPISRLTILPSRV